MKIVIQCAAKRYSEAGSFLSKYEKPVIFVANPESAPSDEGQIYARPDEPSYTGKTWRELLWEYNTQENANPLNLYPAYKLYMNRTYERLVDKFGVDQTYILSAGWGLIRSDFMTPKYDITFSPSAEAYKRRKKRDPYGDFCMIPDDLNEEVIFFGGKDYIPLFCSLTKKLKCRKTVFYNSVTPLELPAGFTPKRYPTRARTNWHYECAKAFLKGEVSIE